MDFLNRAFSQVSDLFASMTPGARIAAALMLVAIVVSLAFLFQQSGTTGDTYLLGGHAFSPGEMPAVQAAIAKAGLNDFEVEGNLIRIPRGKQAEYVAALADAGALPADAHDIMDQVLRDSSPFASSKQRAEQLKIAREQVLAKTISKLSGIEAATVFFDTRPRRGFHRDELVTAAVHVKPLGSAPLESRHVQAIRSLVASSIAGLRPQMVTVVDANTSKTWAGSDSDGVGSSLDDPYLTRMQEYEAYYEAEVLKVLSYVPGATASVNVELDTQQHRSESEVKLDPKPVTLRTSEETSEQVSKKQPGGGRPGLAAQSPNTARQLTAAATSVQESTETTSRSEVINHPSHLETRRDFVGLTPKKVTVSVSVPNDYFVKVWRAQNPTSEGEEPKDPDPAQLAQIEQQESAKIQRAVFQRIPHTDGDDPAALVTVASFAPIEMPEIPAPSMVETTLAWLQTSWSTLGVLGLALFSLLMIRSMVRAAPPQPEMPAVRPGTSPAGAGHAGDESFEDAEADEHEPKLRRRTADGPSLRDELVELVREDPDAAAGILQNWIGNVN